MRRLYTICLYLSIPFILFRLYWKGRKLHAYRSRISERFCFNKKNLSVVDVWLHAASMGEVIAATPLIDALLAKQQRVFVTTMTPTGSQQVIRRFGQQVVHQYVPYDFPFVLRRFFKATQARVGVIMETEIWPNMIIEAKNTGMSLVLANARLSDRAFNQYKQAVFFFKPILGHFSSILAQSEQDAQRFLALGAPKACVKVLGNMKFDMQTHVMNSVHCETLCDKWGKDRPTLIAASTHEGEEELLLKGLTKLKAAIPSLLLLIAPRHPERFQTVYELSLKHHFKTGLRSQESSIDDKLDVIILDSMGELLGFFQVSDYAFIGGSLVPIGGHNVLEPIAMNVPVFCGPYMQNSKAICDELCEKQALYRGNDIDDVIQALIKMSQNPSLHEHQVQQATAVLTANQGTVAKHMQYIEAL